MLTFFIPGSLPRVASTVIKPKVRLVAFSGDRWKNPSWFLECVLFWHNCTQHFINSWVGISEKYQWKNYCWPMCLQKAKMMALWKCHLNYRHCTCFTLKLHCQLFANCRMWARTCHRAPYVALLVVVQRVSVAAEVHTHTTLDSGCISTVFRLSTSNDLRQVRPRMCGLHMSTQCEVVLKCFTAITAIE